MDWLGYNWDSLDCNLEMLDCSLEMLVNMMDSGCRMDW